MLKKEQRHYLAAEIDISKQHKERLDWVDIAKGIAMLCIIAGHFGLANVNRIVFTFHVPIFFLISGYFISQKLTFREYFLKRTKDLLVPYWFTCFLLIIAKIPIDLVKKDYSNIPKDMGMVFIEALYGSGTKSNKNLFGIKPIGAIWFLLALFWALLLVKFFIDVKYGWIWILLIAIIAYVSSGYCWLPFGLQAGGTAAVFVYIGAYLKKKNISIEFRWWLIAISIVAFILEVSFDIRVSVAANYYKYTVISVVGAVLVSYFIMWISKLVESTRFIKDCLSFVGKNSIIFLCFHLVELNNAPWSILFSAMENAPDIVTYSICYIIKLIFITICTLVVLRIKWLSLIFSKPCTNLK